MMAGKQSMAASIIIVTTVATARPVPPRDTKHTIRLELTEYTSDNIINIEWNLLCKAIQAADDHSDMFCELFPFGSYMSSGDDYETVYQKIRARLSCIVPVDMSIQFNVIAGDAYRGFTDWLDATYYGVIAHNV